MTTLQNNIDKIAAALPQLPENLTPEQALNGTLNKLDSLKEIIEPLQQQIYFKKVPPTEAAALMLMGAIQIAGFEGLTIEELSEYTVEAVEKFYSDDDDDDEEDN